MHVLCVVVLGAGVVGAQEPSGAILRLDPALDAIVSPNAQLESLNGDRPDSPANFHVFGLLEGPVWVQQGKDEYLLFTDVAGNVVYKWTRDGKVSVFLEKAGFTGTDSSNAGMQMTSGRLAVLLLGAAGLALDPQGRLVITALADRAVARIEKDGSRTTLADRYEGKRLNGPNDLVVKSNGAIYFTDMTAGLRGGAKSPYRELPFNAVYLIEDGQLRLMDRDPFGIVPNGITLSPDEKYLYVGGSSKIIRYEVRPDDTVMNGRLFVDMSAEGGPDGMKVDQKGNIYSTGPGGVWIISPEGKHLGTIRPPRGVTNFAFGDPDGKTIYFTGRTNLYRMRVNIPGIRPGPRPS